MAKHATNEETKEKITIGIVGLGLIGGSLAAAFKQHDNFEVIGYNRDPEVVKKALHRGFIDHGADAVEAVAADSNVVFICLPVMHIPKTAIKIAKYARKGTIITDVGSTKAHIVSEVEPKMPCGVSFIGGHPMTGSERHGLGAATPALFKNKYYLLTPTANTDINAYNKLHSILNMLDTHVIAIDPDKHDQAVATISHLPHVVAAALMNLAANEASETENLLMLAAGGFKDTTRIAAGNPNIWVDICLDNKKALVKALDNMITMLKNCKKSIRNNEDEKIKEMLERAQKARLSLPTILGKEAEGIYELHIPVVDRPGVISDITLTIGKLGINIEDIELLHATESSGTLRMTLSDKEGADLAAKALSEKGYEVDLIRVK